MFTTWPVLLLSITNLTKDQNCVTNVLSLLLISGFLIGEDDWQCLGMCKTLYSKPLATNLKSQIILQLVYHVQPSQFHVIIFGHPNFQYIKRMFTTLLKNISPEFFPLKSFNYDNMQETISPTKIQNFSHFCNDH